MIRFADTELVVKKARKPWCEGVPASSDEAAVGLIGPGTSVTIRLEPPLPTYQFVRQVRYLIRHHQPYRKLGQPNPQQSSR